MEKQGPQNSITEEHINEMINWFHSEAQKLTQEIHRHHDKHDHYNAAKAEGMRDTYIRCMNKLHALKNQAASRIDP